MPRQARLDAPGTPHHVILRGIERRAIVADKVTDSATDYPHVEGFADAANMIKCMELSLQTLAKAPAGGAVRYYRLQYL